MYPLVNQKARTIFSAAIILLSVSCKKSDVAPLPSTPTSVSAFANDEDFSTSQSTENGTTIVKYRPGPNNGNDVYSDLYWGSPSGNQNYVPELPVNVWDWGGLIVTRSFIQFPKLHKFPENATVVSAKLYLYPPENFLNHPQGNNGVNECVIQRITSENWKEDCLTWSNQPTGVATDDQAIIPTSTSQWEYAPVIDITTAISKMINKEVPNYGFRIMLTNEQPNNAVNFASSEASEAWRRPTLVVEYK